jgi:hypothetical protein
MTTQLFEKSISCPLAGKVTTLLEDVKAQPPGEECFYYDGYVRARSFSHQYISNLLTVPHLRDYLRIDCNSPVFIAAPTGSGKTTFALQTVLDYSKEKGGRIAILCSRTALKYQYQRAAAEREQPEFLETLTTLGLKKQHRFGDVDVFTYQEFYYEANNNPSMLYHRYKAAIFDEAHYFIQDAAFNRFTEATLKLCIKCFKHCPRFYLTATPEFCLDTIIRYERALSSKIVPYTVNGHRNRFFLFYMEKKYDYIQTCFFKDDNDIISLIKEDASDSKYLICVNTKEIGKKLQHKLGNQLAEYIDADAKNNEKSATVDNIIRTGTFDKKVFIATSFLDVGVNLTDTYISNIIVYSTSMTHFIQSIGRKRKVSERMIHLYINIPSVIDIQKSINSIRQKMHQQSDLINNAQNGSLVLDDMPFPFYYNQQLCYNNFYRVYLEQRKQELINMQSYAQRDTFDDAGLAYCYLDWLNIVPDTPLHWLGAKPEDQLIPLADLLSSYANRNLIKAEYDCFLKEFIDKYNAITNDHKRNDRPHKGFVNTFCENHFTYRIESIKTNPITYRITKG